jgi:hypothetical protein
MVAADTRFEGHAPAGAQPVKSYEASGMTEVAEHARSLIAWLDGEIKQLEDDVDDHIDRHPGLKRDAELITSILA